MRFYFLLAFFFFFFNSSFTSTASNGVYLQRDTIGGKVDRFTITLKRMVARAWLKLVYGFKFFRHKLSSVAETVVDVPRGVTRWAKETLPDEEIENIG